MILIGIAAVLGITATLAFQRWVVDRFVKEITFEIDKTCMKLLLNLLSSDSGSILANETTYDTLRFQELRKDNKIVYIEDAPVNPV